MFCLLLKVWIVFKNFWFILNKVSVPPIWIREPKDIRANAGEDIRLECIADGLPKPRVKWISSKGITNYSGRFHNFLNFAFSNSGNIIENEIIDLSKLSLKGNESFECVADNGIGDLLRKVITIYFSGKTFIESSDLAACEYHIEYQAMCGAIDPIKYIKFYLNFFET